MGEPTEPLPEPEPDWGENPNAYAEWLSADDGPLLSSRAGQAYLLRIIVALTVGVLFFRSLRFVLVLGNAAVAQETESVLTQSNSWEQVPRAREALC